MDQIRLIALGSLTKIAGIFTREENKKHVLPLIIKCSQDPSWRVRHKLAQIYSDLTTNYLSSGN